MRMFYETNCNEKERFCNNLLLVLNTNNYLLPSLPRTLKKTDTMEDSKGGVKLPAGGISEESGSNPSPLDQD